MTRPADGAPRAVPPSGLDRRLAWLVATVGAAAFVVLGVLVVPWAGWPGGADPAPVSSLFTAAEVARAEEHARAVRALSLGATGVALALALAFALTRAGGDLARWLTARLPWWIGVAATTLVLLGLGRLVTLPLAHLVRERNLAAGLTTQSLSGWLTDRVLGTLVHWVGVTLLVLLVLAAARRAPRRWFLGAGAATAGCVFVLSAAYPLVVEPLFNEFRPMPAGPLRASLLDLADRQGVDVEEVLVADASRRTTTLNAYVSGIGDTRRIVVYDTLLADLPPAQVRSVAAHELAHAAHHDVVVGTGLAALGSVVGVSVLALLLDHPRLRRRAGVTGAGDPAAAALVLALVAAGGLLASPVQNAISRAVEVRADQEALEVTGDPAAFRRLQRQLALRSLADPTPPTAVHLWFGSHPTALQRVAMADQQPPRLGVAR